MLNRPILTALCFISLLALGSCDRTAGDDLLLVDGLDELPGDSADELPPHALRLPGDDPAPFGVPLRVPTLVLYDDTGPWGYLGELYAQVVVTLLGHFKEVEPHARTMQTYEPGLLLEHDVAIYIGATWNGAPGPGFAKDFEEFTGRFAWLGYNFWHLDEDRWRERFGFWSTETAVNDGHGRNRTFYRDVRYAPDHAGREVVLDKYERWERGRFENDPYLQLIEIDDPDQVEVLADIEHSGTGERVPYALRSGRLYFFADIPFTFLHETDRYLVFTDVLHDIVGLEHEPSRQALFRLEDVHPVNPIPAIDEVADILWTEDDAQRPWSMAFVPRFVDPQEVYGPQFPNDIGMNDEEAGPWREVIESAVDRGATFVQHGTTHQYGEHANPVNGLTGTDWEFWIPRDGTSGLGDPVPEDSPDWFTDRVETGRTAMRQQGWEPWAFEFPHYEASLLDHLVLGELYDTIYHRPEFYAYRVEWYELTWTFEDFRNGLRDRVVIDWDSVEITGQDEAKLGAFMPYYIDRDAMGMKIIPENLGYLAPAELVPEGQLEEIRLIGDVLRYAEANLSQRCAYASHFFHAFLVQTDYTDSGGADNLRRLIHGIEDLGYSYVDASQLGPKEAINFPQER